MKKRRVYVLPEVYCYPYMDNTDGNACVVYVWYGIFYYFSWENLEINIYKECICVFRHEFHVSSLVYLHQGVILNSLSSSFKMWFFSSSSFSSRISLRPPIIFCGPKHNSSYHPSVFSVALGMEYVRAAALRPMSPFLKASRVRSIFSSSQDPYFTPLGILKDNKLKTMF
jgi:hypothetical protein